MCAALCLHPPAYLQQKAAMRAGQAQACMHSSLLLIVNSRSLTLYSLSLDTKVHSRAQEAPTYLDIL